MKRKQFSVMLSENELALIGRISKELDLSISAFIRKTALNSAQKIDRKLKRSGLSRLAEKVQSRS